MRARAAAERRAADQSAGRPGSARRSGRGQPPDSLDRHVLLLQRTAGNAAVGRARASLPARRTPAPARPVARRDRRRRAHRGPAPRRRGRPARGTGWRAPPLFASVAADQAVRPVLSATRVGGRRCDLVAYFAPPRPAGPPAFREWGTRLSRTRDGSGWRWVPGPAADPPAATDLAPFLRSGQVAWIQPFDMGVELRSGPEGCPWLGGPPA